MLRGTVGFWERRSILKAARSEFGAKPKVRFGQIKDEFIPARKPNGNLLNLTGSRFGKHNRGTFFEEVQHAIDDVQGLTPRRLPTPGSLENAVFHEEVFGRLIKNPIFDVNPVEKLNLMRKIRELVVGLGGNGASI